MASVPGPSSTTATVGRIFTASSIPKAVGLGCRCAPRSTPLEFSAALAEVARRLEAGPSRRGALLLDGEGWHRAKALVWPEGIHPIRLPAYSPELQPAEPLWPVTNENVVNRPFAEPSLPWNERLPGDRQPYLGNACGGR